MLIAPEAGPYGPLPGPPADRQARRARAPAAALRIAPTQGPLEIGYVLGGTTVDWRRFNAGIAFSEGEQGARYVKRPGRNAVKTKCAPDATTEIAAATGPSQRLGPRTPPA